MGTRELHPRFAWLHPVLRRLYPISEIFRPVAESYSPMTGKVETAGGMTVPFLKSPAAHAVLGPAGLGGKAPGGVAEKGVLLLGRELLVQVFCGTTETTPLVTILFRLLLAVAQHAHLAPRRTASSLAENARTQAAASQRPSPTGNPATTLSPQTCGPNPSFRRHWTRRKAGERFARKRLMEMRHRFLHNGDR